MRPTRTERCPAPPGPPGPALLQGASDEDGPMGGARATDKDGESSRSPRAPVRGGTRGLRQPIRTGGLVVRSGNRPLPPDTGTRLKTPGGAALPPRRTHVRTSFPSPVTLSPTSPPRNYSLPRYPHSNPTHTAITFLLIYIWKSFNYVVHLH